MIKVITIKGKACNVFDAIRLMTEKAGKLTIGEIARLSQLKMAQEK